VDQTTANVRVAEAGLLQARQGYDRFQKINPNAVTRQQIDAQIATFHSAEAKMDASWQMVGGAQTQVIAAQAQVLAAQASLKQAEANTQAAELQISYCVPSPHRSPASSPIATSAPATTSILARLCSPPAIWCRTQSSYRSAVGLPMSSAANGFT
jgi:hypothetical protein